VRFGPQVDNVVIYQNDHLGTPQKLTAVNGAVVWSAKYSSFGQAEVDLSSTVTNNLRFAGQYFDAETSLHYNYKRYYDPETGKYLRVDPIGLAGGINLFLYASGNPINNFDPKGDLVWTIEVVVLIAIAAITTVVVLDHYRRHPLKIPALPSTSDDDDVGDKVISFPKDPPIDYDDDDDDDFNCEEWLMLLNMQHDQISQLECKGYDMSKEKSEHNLSAQLFSEYCPHLSKQVKAF